MRICADSMQCGEVYPASDSSLTAIKHPADSSLNTVENLRDGLSRRSDSRHTTVVLLGNGKWVTSTRSIVSRTELRGEAGACESSLHSRVSRERLWLYLSCEGHSSRKCVISRHEASSLLLSEYHRCSCWLPSRARACGTINTTGSGRLRRRSIELPDKRTYAVICIEDTPEEYQYHL